MCISISYSLTHDQDFNDVIFSWTWSPDPPTMTMIYIKLQINMYRGQCKKGP